MAIKRDGHFVTIQQHIVECQQNQPTVTAEFSWLLSAITLSTKMIASYVRRAGLLPVWGQTGDENIQGETVQRLDLIANETIKQTLGYRGNVGVIASEEDDEPRVLQEVDRGGDYIVMFDPLDGSSNIDANISIGTIFTVFRNLPQTGGAAMSVLQPGCQQLAAGYVVYGSSTVLVYTTGHGVHMFTLDPQFGAYLLTRENIRMPDHACQYAVNEAYLRQFPPGYQQYLDWAKDEAGGGYSSRYIGSLVADFHRVLIKGGVFLYPPTGTHARGKLRLMYEANPLAFVAEQAGGAASDGSQRILDIRPCDVHDRTPVIMGSRQNVDQVLGFVQRPAASARAAT